MKLTIDIPEKLLARIVRASTAATEEDAVLQALEEFATLDAPTDPDDNDDDLDAWGELLADEDPAPDDIPPRPG